MSEGGAEADTAPLAERHADAEALVRVDAEGELAVLAVAPDDAEVDGLANADSEELCDTEARPVGVDELLSVDTGDADPFVEALAAPVAVNSEEPVVEGVAALDPLEATVSLTVGVALTSALKDTLALADENTDGVEEKHNVGVGEIDELADPHADADMLCEALEHIVGVDEEQGVGAGDKDALGEPLAVSDGSMLGLDEGDWPPLELNNALVLGQMLADARELRVSIGDGVNAADAEWHGDAVALGHADAECESTALADTHDNVVLDGRVDGDTVELCDTEACPVGVDEPQSVDASDADPSSDALKEPVTEDFADPVAESTAELDLLGAGVCERDELVDPRSDADELAHADAGAEPDRLGDPLTIKDEVAAIDCDGVMLCEAVERADCVDNEDAERDGEGEADSSWVEDVVADADGVANAESVGAGD